MTAIYRVPLPVMERIALEDLAKRRGMPEVDMLALIVRDAVANELAQQARRTPRSKRTVAAPATSEGVRA